MPAAYECGHGTVHLVCECMKAHMHVRGARGVVRESDAVSGVTLGLLVFLLSMKGMT